MAILKTPLVIRQFFLVLGRYFVQAIFLAGANLNLTNHYSETAFLHGTSSQEYMPKLKDGGRTIGSCEHTTMLLPDLVFLSGEL